MRRCSAPTLIGVLSLVVDVLTKTTLETRRGSMCREKLPRRVTRGQITAALLTALLFCVTAKAQTEQAKLVASDAAANDFFGRSVSIFGDTALVGTQSFGGFGLSSAYVFVRSGRTWSQEAKLTASDAAANDRFGFSVSISGDTALVGAYRDADAGFSLVLQR